MRKIKGWQCSYTHPRFVPRTIVTSYCSRELLLWFIINQHCFSLLLHNSLFSAETMNKFPDT